MSFLTTPKRWFHHVAAVVLAACPVVATTTVMAQALPVVVPDDARVVMMPPDIRYYLISAGGNPELHEEWTADAESGFAAAIAELSELHGVEMPVLGRDELGEEALAYEGLHAALGEALIEHVVNAARLPSKGTNELSDWTLGPGVQSIRETTGADYALFVHYRENQASGSRLAFAILAATARVSIPTSSEHGFATLIDLSTGDVAWFGVLYDDGFEVRESDGANYMASWLLGELPMGSSSFADVQETQ